MTGLRRAAPALVLALAAAPAAAQTAPEITAADLRARVEALAHDSLFGRDPGTPGARRTAEHLAAEMRRLGLRPAGDAGTYFHRVDLQRTVTTLDASVEGPRGGPLGPADLRLISGMADLPATGRTYVRGPLRYGGWTADDAPAALGEEALRGAVLVVRLGARPGARAPRERYPLAGLLGPGSPVAAVLLVAEGDDLTPLWDYAEETAAKGALAPSVSPDILRDLPPILLVSPAALARLLGREAPGDAPAADAGTLTLRIVQDRRPIEAMNVVALLPGRERARAAEYVVVGSHYDHVGIGAAVDGDSIYNGADDDASGVAVMLEVAERMATLPAERRPARSLLFVWHTAEEAGLLGADQFTRRPPVPRGQMVAMLNLDMVGRNAPDSLLVLGSRRLSTRLGTLVEEVNARQARPFALDYSWDAPDHPERFYCRSDHYHYARYGIPVAFFTGGLHPQYHQPQDEAHTLDYEKMARVATLVGAVMAEIGELPARPALDRPLPPLGAPCR